MTTNIIIFPKNKIKQEEKNIVNKEAIDKQYKKLLHLLLWHSLLPYFL